MTTIAQFEKMLKAFNTSSIEIHTKNNDENTSKNYITAFSKGDVIACFAGNVFRTICVVELTDTANLDDINKSITNNSIIPSYAHMVSPNWFKINE